MKGEVLRGVIGRDIRERMDRLERAALTARRREDVAYRRPVDGVGVGLVREKFVNSNTRRLALNRVVAIEAELEAMGWGGDLEQLARLTAELDAIRARIEAL